MTRVEHYHEQVLPHVRMHRIKILTLIIETRLKYVKVGGDAILYIALRTTCVDKVLILRNEVIVDLLHKI